MAKRVYNDSDYEWSYEVDGDIAIFDMEGWLGYEEDELKGGTEAYRQVASQGDIRGTVAILTDAKAIPPEQKDYIAKQWADNGNYVEVDRIAFVSDGTIGLTIKANIVDKIEGAEVENFNDVEEAVEWAKNA